MAIVKPAWYTLTVNETHQYTQLDRHKCNQARYQCRWPRCGTHLPHTRHIHTGNQYRYNHQDKSS